jgi:hypothetical protein
MNNYVFIIDLDKTIIGDCIYQSELYKISIILAKLGIKIKINDILEPQYTEKSKLIRPHFTDFINKMKEIFNNNCYFFIYTASEKKWANKQISLIEKNLDIKFNRPIFTRNDCSILNEDDKISYMKSIEAIKKKIKIPNAEIIIIDDKEVYVDSNNRLIKCNVYNYKLFCNYWDYIPINKIKNKVFLAYLSTLIDEERLNPLYITHNIKQQIDYYKWLYDKCNKINNINKKYKQDIFWLSLTKIICENNIKYFNPAAINFIKKSIIYRKQ